MKSAMLNEGARSGSDGEQINRRREPKPVTSISGQGPTHLKESLQFYYDSVELSLKLPFGGPDEQLVKAKPCL